MYKINVLKDTCLYTIQYNYIGVTKCRVFYIKTSIASSILNQNVYSLIK